MAQDDRLGATSGEIEEERTSWTFEETDEIAPGRYPLKSLGGGHVYEAFLAWDEHLFSLIVAKLIRPHLVEDSRALRNLRTEAGILARLSHPVIVHGYGSTFEGPTPHLLMEYLEGPNLSSLIRRHARLQLDQLLPLALYLCGSLAYLVNERVVHLDVKPRNIVMGIPPRLIDLSVARSFESAHNIKGHVGTDLYMAPEQCDPRQLGPIGPAADVWGLGITLYEAASGERPFVRYPDWEEGDLVDRFPQLHYEPLPLPKRLPEPLIAAISSCLAKDPSERPAARDLAAMLEPLVEVLPKKRILGRRRPRLE